MDAAGWTISIIAILIATAIALGWERAGRRGGRGAGGGREREGDGGGEP